MKTENKSGLQLDLDFSPPSAIRNSLRWAASALVAVAAGYTMPTAVAQESQPQAGALEEVFVTARRREESLQDVPIAVTAMDNNYLREQNVTELSDLGLHVPSLRFSEGGASTNIPLITLRGQRPSEVLLTLDPAVPIYFAEVVLTPSQGTNLGMYDLANVQVLKGPQGTLFGRNSTGGALLLTPQTPGTELGGYGEVKVGDYNLYQFEGAADLPVNDQLQFRLAGRSLDRDGYQTNVADNELHGDEFWDEDSYGYRLTTNYEPTDRLSTLTTLAYDKNDMNTRVAIPQAFNSSSRLGTLTELVHNGGIGVGGPDVDEALARQKTRDWTDIETDVGAKEQVENWIVSNIVEYELADALSLKNILGYRNLNSQQNADVDGTAVPLFGAATSLTESVTPNSPPGITTASQYSEELQLLGNSFDDKLDWIVGAYWMRMQGSESYTSQVQGANPEWPAGGIGVPQIDAIALNGYLQLSPNANTDNEAWALYSEGTYTINDKWSVTAGARQTWDDRKMDAMNFSTNTTTLQYGCAMFDPDNQPLPNDNCSRKVGDSFDELTGRGSLNFTPTDTMLLYTSVASGYRTGGYNARGVNDFTLQPFDPETVVTYEFGQKTDWDLFDLALMRTNLAIYYQDYDDIQKTISGTNPASGNFESYTVNAAKAEISGLEFEVTIAPTDNLNLSVAYSYVDAKYKQWDRETNPGVISDFSGVPFVYVPENSFSGSVAYTLPLDAAYGDVMLIGSVYWQDKMITNDGAFLWPSLGWSEDNLQEALATVEADDYTVANFRVDWRSAMGSQFDAAAFVNNAFDEDYVTGGLSVPDSLGWVGSTYGPPRTYGVSLRYNF